MASSSPQVTPQPETEGASEGETELRSPPCSPGSQRPLWSWDPVWRVRRQAWPPEGQKQCCNSRLQSRREEGVDQLLEGPGTPSRSSRAGATAWRQGMEGDSLCIHPGPSSSKSTAVAGLLLSLSLGSSSMQDPAGPPQGPWPSPGLQEVCPAWRAKKTPAPGWRNSYHGPGLGPRSCEASKPRSLPGQTCTGWGWAPG